MTTADSGSPSGSDSLRFVWTALRLAGGTLGVLTLLHVATFGLDVEYTVLFQNFLDRLKDLIDLTPLLDPIEKFVVLPFLDWLRGYGWVVPELGEHWRYVFTLVWLLLVALARQSPGRLLMQIAWAFICAFAVGVACGTVRLESVAIFVWPVAGIALFGFQRDGWRALRRREWSVLIIPAMAAVLALWGYADSSPLEAPFGILVPSPGLLYLAGFVGTMGLWFLVYGLMKGDARRRRADNQFAMGLDVVSVLGAALAIGWLMLA